MHAPVAAAAGAASGAGLWLFSYNRENFQFDAGMRFQRFMAARGFANAQTAQYREDIQGLAEMTVAKMDTWQSVCTLFLCVCAALSCAGRLGMHGAAPPGWLCALYSGNIFLGILFCGLALWLAMHASLRAQCAMVSLLTRKVRLPIPSLAQLDQARVFASAYEQQRVGDMFRVPFLRHPESAPDLPPGGGEASEQPHSGTEFDSTARDTVPSWIRDEQVIDKLGGVPSSGAPVDREPGDAPEHFKLMAKAMEDWWQYDVYARISMLYGVVFFLFAVTYYSIGTTMSELRGFWISWSLPMLFLTAQALILRLDIVRDNGQKYLPHCEWFGHIAPYFAVCGTTLEFRFWYSPSIVTLTWVLVICAFFGHFVMALRMLDLAWPDLEREADMPDVPTRQWWPSSWKVPSAFSKALWVLAPPKKLEAGQECLLHEMADLKQGGATITACRRRRRRPASPKTGSSSAGNAGWTNPQALFLQCNRIDLSFRQLFVGSVWNELTERHQRQLHGLYGEYQTARRQVEQLPEGASGGEAEAGRHAKPEEGEQNHLGEIADSLAKIEDGLEEVASKSKATNQGEGAYTGSSPFKDFSQKRLPDLPWQVMYVAILTAALQWLYMMIASAVECSLGPESLLKPPGEPPWIRDQKMRSWTPEMIHLSSDDSLPEDYGLLNPTVARPPLEHTVSSESSSSEGHTEATSGSHSDASHRRLAAAYSRRPRAALGELLDALPALGRLTDSLEQDRLGGARLEGAQPERPVPAAGAPAAPAFMAPVLKARSVAWPPLFEPRHLLCRPGAALPAFLALTPRGFGALVPAGEGVEAQPFALEGVGGLGPLVGATWAEEGLELVTEVGELLRCPGHSPAELGTWSCRATPEAGAGRRLPLPEGSRLLAAAVQGGAGAGGGAGGGVGRWAALSIEQLPGTVALLTEDSDGWAPAGEVHLPPGSSTESGRIGLAFVGDELLITTMSGEVQRRHLRDGRASTHPAPAVSASRREYHAACGVPNGGLVRLALRPLARPHGGVAWGPELLVQEA